uniref:DM domain-containing protein n=1 Tax=Heterorhabditis bacteriophora TaxID=37862 RepID=A0A1I7XLF1_HETBA
MAVCDMSPHHLFPMDVLLDPTHLRQLMTQIKLEPREILSQRNGLPSKDILGPLQRLPPKEILPFIAENEPKKVYFCQRCLNHGISLPRKNHKCECPYVNCACEYCILVERRRKLNSQLHDLEGASPEPEKLADDEDRVQRSRGIDTTGDEEKTRKGKGGKPLV